MRSVLIVLSVLVSSTTAFAGDFVTTCQTLGEAGQCHAVTFCTERTEGMCIPKLADRTNPQWIKACAAAGPDEHTCGWQAFCEWQGTTQCVPVQ